MDKKAEALDVAIGKEKNMRVYKRLIAVRMVMFKEIPIHQAADLVDTSDRSVYGWVKRYEERGVEGLYNAEIPGSGPKVKYEKIYKKMSALAKINKLEPKTLRNVIYNCYGVLYSLCQIRRIMHKLSFSPKVAAATFANKASKRMIRIWQSCLKWRSSCLRRRGFKMVKMDESLFVNGFYKGKKLWSKTGEKIHIIQTGGHKRIVVYGALAEDGSQMFRTYEYFNAETFVKYLEEMRVKWGKIMVILDNAPQHTAGIVKRYLKEHKKEVILHFLPVSSPELSAVEECWRRAKREILVGKYYSNLEDMWDVVSEYFRTTYFGLDIRKYLWRIT